MTKCLIVTRDVDQWSEAVSSGLFPSIDATVTADPDEAQIAAAEAEIMMGVPPLLAPHVKVAKNLKWIQSSFAGVDALVAEGMRRDYSLTNVKGIYGGPIAEYVFAYVLSEKRRLPWHAQLQQRSEWKQTESAVVDGKTIVIFGTGSIGSEVARVAKAFGLKTVGVNNGGKSAENFDACFSVSDKTKALVDADYIVGVLPSTPETNSIFDSDFFDSLKSSPMFINVGRGSNVNEQDLLDALDKGRIRHAVLDVFQTEPLPSTSAIWTHPGITVTPHNSGYVSLEKIAKVCSANYKRYLAGQTLENLIDFEKGY